MSSLPDLRTLCSEKGSSLLYDGDLCWLGQSAIFCGVRALRRFGMRDGLLLYLLLLEVLHAIDFFTGLCRLHFSNRIGQMVVVEAMALSRHRFGWTALYGICVDVRDGWILSGPVLFRCQRDHNVGVYEFDQNQGRSHAKSANKIRFRSVVFAQFHLSDAVDQSFGLSIVFARDRKRFAKICLGKRRKKFEY